MTTIRRLIQPTTVRPPAIFADTRPSAVLAGARFGREPAQSRVRAMPVEIPLEIKELHLQIRGRPERLVRVPAGGSDVDRKLLMAETLAA